MRLRVWIIRHWFWFAICSFVFIATVSVLRKEVPDDEKPWKMVYADNGSLLDLHHFAYTMNSDVCQKTDVFLVIFVHSAPAHFYNREVIRKTWGKVTVDGKNVRTLFLVAQIEDKNLQDVLRAESESHGDLVQGNFVDSYRNLTYKHVMGLKWISTHCSEAKFAIKMDDDIFIDIYRMVRFLEKRYPQGLSTSIGCYVQTGMPVMRDETNKWFVSRQQYPSDRFEDYCSGWAYMLSPSVAEKLADTSRYFKFFWIDDVYVTGTLATHARLKRDFLNWIFTISTGSLLDWVRSKDGRAWRYLVGPTWGDMLLMEEAHKKATKCWETQCSCCSPRKQVAPLSPVFPNNASLKGKAEIIGNHWT